MCSFFIIDMFWGIVRNFFPDLCYTIGNTVKSQYSEGVYKISQWADVINAHSISGDGCVKGLREASDVEKRGCLLIAQLSCKGNLIDENYIKGKFKSLKMTLFFYRLSCVQLRTR